MLSVRHGKKLSAPSLKTMLLINRFNSELRMRLRVSDIMRYKSIRSCIRGKRRISWLHEEYDELKPTLIFVQGIVMLNDTEHLHNLFAEHFNVLVIEPIQNHYDKLFSGEHYDDVVAFYLMSVQLLLPEEAKIAGAIGFSFGGAVAFGMAAAWQKQTGESVPVIMGDTFLPKAGKIPTNEIKRLTAEDLRKMVDAFEFKDHEYTEKELQNLADLNNMVAVLYSENSLAPYSGDVLFLNAHRNSTEEAMSKKMDALRKNAPQAEIKEFKDYSHSSIFVAEELHPFYREAAKKLLDSTAKETALVWRLNMQVLYIHGKGGNAAESMHYKPLFPHDKVIGLDYQTFSPGILAGKFGLLLSSWQKSMKRLS